MLSEVAHGHWLWFKEGRCPDGEFPIIMFVCVCVCVHVGGGEGKGRGEGGG